jgi:DNA recombination protein RmuC
MILMSGAHVLVSLLVLLGIVSVGVLLYIRKLPDAVTRTMEGKHRAMLTDLHDGLTRQGDRISGAVSRTRG